MNILALCLCCIALMGAEAGSGNRVKRQLNALLTVLQQNPQLLQHLQQNPSILSQVGQTAPALLSDIPTLKSSSSSSSSLNAAALLANQQCAALKKQNKVLRQMLLSVTGHEPLTVEASSPRELLLAAAIDNPAQALLHQMVGAAATTSVVVSSVLVSASPVWLTETQLTSYVSTVTQTASTEVPIILRGSKVITTILEQQVQVITTTETQTSSSLITPSPTWSTFMVTLTPSITHSPPPVLADFSPDTLALADIISFRAEPDRHQDQTKNPRKRNFGAGNVVQAKVVEIPEPRSSPALSNQDRFKQAYGAFFASSAQRSAQKFRPQRLADPSRFPETGKQDQADLSDFDQQGLAAFQNPVFAQGPNAAASAAPRQKVFTLYFSGSVPGQISTQLTTLPVDEAGKPLIEVRLKREAISQVRPIQQTILGQSPDMEQLPDQLPELLELQSSMSSSANDVRLCQPTKTVTITTTVTLTTTS